MTDYPNDLDGVRWEKDDAKKAGYLIFDRPPMNTISFKGRSQIAAIIRAMDDDPDVRVIVIRGANGFYSSGGDIVGFLKVSATVCTICTGMSRHRSVRRSRLLPRSRNGRWAFRSSCRLPAISAS